MLKYIGAATGVGVVCGAAYVATDADLSEQVSRTAYFWTQAFPIYLHYRYTQWRVEGMSDEEQDAAYNQLHDRYAPEVLRIALRLKGFYIKMAQLGSTRNDFVPRQYLERFSTLQDRVPARDGAFARRMVEDAFGGKLEDHFSEFDPVALGAASIGQVHAARLRKDGTEVVVKIQYPDMERLVFLDLANSRLFSRIAQPEYIPMLDEVERQVKTEFDFTREGRMLEAVGNNIRPHFDAEVVIPRPIAGLVSPRVFVMERIHGVKLIDGIKQQFEAIARAQGVTLLDLIEQARKNPPTEFQIRLLKWRFLATSVLANSRSALHNTLVAPFTGHRREYVRPLVFIDERRVLHTLFRVHGHQIFVNGLFNGDCHPGNIILMPDGRLGLIDYGQVKEIDPASRRQLALLIKALASGDRQRVIDQFASMGFKSKRMDPWVVEKTARIYFDRCDREATEGLNLQLFIDKLTANDPTEVFPENHLFAARTSLLLRGLGTLLNHPVSAAQAWTPYADQILGSPA